MVNVIPVDPPVFPILYTWNVEENLIDSLSGLGCIDTVYSTTNRKKKTTREFDFENNIHVSTYEKHCSVPNTACSSYIQQADLISGITTNTNNLVAFGYDLNLGSGIFFFGIFILALLGIVVVGVWLLMKIAESMHGAEELKKTAL
jgi:hypothetical protein